MKQTATILLVLSGLLIACKDSKEVFDTAAVTDFMPLAVGKSMTYRLDSVVFERSGTVKEVHKYQVKHSITGQTTDNLGRITFIVQRQLNNENATGSWIGQGSYLITPYENKIEVIQDNLRVVVLQLPIKQGFSWKGNSYLIRPGENSDASPYSDLYDMFVDNEMYQWDFTYTNFSDDHISGQPYSDVWTVSQSNDSLNIPPTPQTAIGYKAVSVEKYAKGVGLVYKDYQLYDYQGPGAVDNPSAHYTGFGVTMWLIAHD